MTDTSLEYLTFRSEGDRHPVFFIYHLSGDVNFYRDLAVELGPDQPSYGLLSPAYFDESKAPESMEQAASRIVDLLKTQFNDSRPALVGYSWAGWLAFEVARQWTEQGGEMPYVCILGMSAPFTRMPGWKKVLHMIRWLPSWLWEVCSDSSTLPRILSAVKRFSSKPAFAEAPNVQEWSKDGLPRHHIKIGNRYKPVVKIPIPIELIREKDEYHKNAHPLHYYSTDHLPDAGWTKFAHAAPHVSWLSTSHRDIMLQPVVSKLAEIIRRRMNDFYDGKEINTLQYNL